MKKFKLLTSALLAALCGACERITRPRGAVALANVVGGSFQTGRDTFIVDSTVTTPVTGGRYLLWEYGVDQYHAKLADGGATLASLPIGASPDAPYQAGDFFTVERLGATPGTVFVQTAGAVTYNHLVVSSGTGLVSDVATVANGTYWVVGRAAFTIAFANGELPIVPVDPYLITVTAGVLTNPANPL
jgi:hypothetical protein